MANMHAKWKPIVPKSFTVPKKYQSSQWVFSQLTVGDVDGDFLAVTKSADRLRGMFDFFPAWPNKNITKAEDLSNLGWHQTEFEMKTSFAYKIQQVSRGGKRYVGCAYIFPSNDPDYQIDAYLWVKAGYEQSDQALFRLFQKWLEDHWPFDKIKYPGRSK